MSHRMEKVNKNIQRVFGAIIAAEVDLPPDVLVTVTGVETTRNLNVATVWLSVLPTAHEDTVMAALTQQMYDLQGLFNRAVHMKPLPRLKLRIDHGASNSVQLERKINQLA